MIIGREESNDRMAGSDVDRGVEKVKQRKLWKIRCDTRIKSGSWIKMVYDKITRRHNGECKMRTFRYQQLEMGAALSIFIALNVVPMLLGKNPKHRGLFYI